MSQSKSKQQRKETKDYNKVVGQILISVTKKGAVLLDGLPNNYPAAMDVMHRALSACESHFFNLAMQGRIDMALCEIPLPKPETDGGNGNGQT